MYVVKCEIRIGEGASAFRMNRATAVEIRKSAHLLTNTAVIRIPTTALMKNVKASTTVEVANEIKAGMPVNIRLWYQGAEDQAITFSGFVRRVNRKTPVEVECEDAVRLLRQKNINCDWKDTMLRTILEEIVDGTGIPLAPGVPPVHLKAFYLKNKSGLDALRKVQDELGMSVYLNPRNELYCGLAYQENYGTVRYVLNGKAANIVRADNLQWQEKEDIRLCVKAIAVKEDNSCLSETVGDVGGAVKVLRFHQVESREELKALAQQELNKLQFEGYRGKITAFLLPGVAPGMVAELKDDRYPDREGTYFVESVRTTFGVGGCRNEVELGLRMV